MKTCVKGSPCSARKPGLAPARFEKKTRDGIGSEARHGSKHCSLYGVVDEVEVGFGRVQGRKLVVDGVANEVGKKVRVDVGKKEVLDSDRKNPHRGANTESLAQGLEVGELASEFRIARKEAPNHYRDRRNKDEVRVQRM